MNWLKKGPELKMPRLRGGRPRGPEIRPPAFLADLYYDLRDRRLLPLIALVLVAIVAVPILMSSGSKGVPEVPGGGAAAIEAATGRASRLTVVEATPGLRDYRKRLAGRSPADPFKQQYATPPGGGSSGGGGSSSSGSGGTSITSEESSTTVEVETGGGSGGGDGSSGGSGGRSVNPQGNGVRLFEFVFDVQISHSVKSVDGDRKMSKPEVRRGVKTLAQLPGKKTPVVTMAGVNLHTGKVWLLVSDEVRRLDGDFKCTTRAPGRLCELLEIETGFPLELVYGPDEVVYRIKVVKIDTVWSGRPGDRAGASRAPRAAFDGLAVAAPGGHRFSK